MRADRNIVTLRELCADYKKDIVDGPFGANLKREHFTSEGIPVLKIQNIKPFNIVLKKMDYVNAEKAAELQRHAYKSGDIIITKLGLPLGVSAIVEDMDDGLIVADLVRVRASKVDTKYLCYHLNSPVTSEFLNAQSAGATRPRVKITAVRDLPIYAPPLPEQKRIVAILDEAFAGIDAAVANTEKNLANARELFESYLNGVFTQKAEGWVEKKLGDADLIQIIDGDRGVNYPKKADFSNEGYCLFLNTKNVRPDGFNFDTKMFITEEKDKALRKGKLKRRDVILTTRGTIGNIAVYDNSVDYDEIRINSGMLIFRPNEKVILSEYLFEILRSGIMKVQTERFVSGAAQPQLPIKTLVNFSIPVPVELADQRHIVARLKNLSDETKRLEAIYQQKLTALAELKQSILQKAFAGELTTLPEKILEEAVA